MSNRNIDNYLSWIHEWMDGYDHLSREILRHEMSATMHRFQTTKTDTGVSSLNTAQLAWCVCGATDKDTLVEHPVFAAFLTSALFDGHPEVIKKADDLGLIPKTLPWVEWAIKFKGTSKDLLDKLAGSNLVRNTAGAAALAAHHCPDAVSGEMLKLFANKSMTKAFNQLALTGLTGANRHEVAETALTIYASNPEILFSGSVDSLLAQMISHSRPTEVDNLIRPFDGAIGERTRAAVAESKLRAGQPKHALELVKDQRLLSPAFGQSALIASLACLELNDIVQAERYAAHVEDQVTKMKIQTRIAQSRGDYAQELELLVDLHENDQSDPDTFMQLLTSLDRMGQHQMSRELCLARQELFLDNDLIKQQIAARIN